jgi:hypothetical protein
MCPWPRHLMRRLSYSPAYGVYARVASAISSAD